MQIWARPWGRNTSKNRLSSHDGGLGSTSDRYRLVSCCLPKRFFLASDLQQGTADCTEIGRRRIGYVRCNTEAKFLMLTHAFELWNLLACAFTRTPETRVRELLSNESAQSMKAFCGPIVWPPTTLLGVRNITQTWRRNGRLCRGG